MYSPCKISARPIKLSTKNQPLYPSPGAGGGANGLRESFSRFSLMYNVKGHLGSMSGGNGDGGKKLWGLQKVSGFSSCLSGMRGWCWCLLVGGGQRGC